METKPRILYLMRILERCTDEEHPLTTKQLIDKLQDEYGISAHRTTLTKDIVVVGMDTRIEGWDKDNFEAFIEKQKRESVKEALELLRL